MVHAMGVQVVKQELALNMRCAWLKIASWLTPVLFGALLCLGSCAVTAKTSPEFSAAASETVALADLPKQGRETYALIFKGGPFPYPKDGVVFGNRERILPKAPRGYYHEYTVKTPYSRNRGAKRIVCGGKAMVPDACFYSDDHYASFRRIVP
jgi:ribonuclease T1